MRDRVSLPAPVRIECVICTKGFDAGDDATWDQIVSIAPFRYVCVLCARRVKAALFDAEGV